MRQGLFFNSVFTEEGPEAGEVDVREGERDPEEIQRKYLGERAATTRPCMPGCRGRGVGFCPALFPLPPHCTNPPLCLRSPHPDCPGQV